MWDFLCVLGTSLVICCGVYLSRGAPQLVGLPLCVGDFSGLGVWDDCKCATILALLSFGLGSPVQTLQRRAFPEASVLRNPGVGGTAWLGRRSPPPASRLGVAAGASLRLLRWACRLVSAVARLGGSLSLSGLSSWQHKCSLSRIHWEATERGRRLLRSVGRTQIATPAGTRERDSPWAAEWAAVAAGARDLEDLVTEVAAALAVAQLQLKRLVSDSASQTPSEWQSTVAALV